MKKPLVLFCFLLCSSSFAQIGAKVQQSKIFGIWQNSQFGYQMVLLLKEDNTGEFDGETIRFSMTGNKLTITQAGITTQYTFAQQDNSLTLSGGDLEGALTFTRQGKDATAQQSMAQTSEPTRNSSAKGSSDLTGLWSGNGESIEFKNNGMCNYLGQTYPYEVSQGHVTLTTLQGKLMMAYSIANNQLTLTANGRQLVYSKGAASTTGTNRLAAGSGAVAQELVGKWCYVNVYSSSSGGSSTSNCITLNADGTYEYYGESSRSVSTPDMYGGTASQSSDRGTWWVQGDRIYYNSQTQGQGSYQLQKQNHPKNGDPMIVLDGQTYVTFYNKPPWR